jgi:hypothetical protein
MPYCLLPSLFDAVKSRACVLRSICPLATQGEELHISSRDQWELPKVCGGSKQASALSTLSCALHLK